MYKLCEKGLNFIANFEGFRDKPYICAAGYLTIGFGHVIRKNEYFNQITNQEALTLLKKDVSFVEIALNKLLKIDLVHNQFIALASLSFNIGTGAFQRSSLRQKVNRGEFVEATEEFLKWVRAGGEILPGLVKRRKAEARLFCAEPGTSNELIQ